MGQVKKPEVRDAILKTALQLFSKKGYARTTLEEIARGSGMSPANVYVYFRSKLEILYAIYDPWMRERLTNLEEKLKDISDSRRKLRLLLTTLWRDMPAEKHGFVNNIMQAISSATPRDRYKPHLLKWMEEHLERMLRASLPDQRNRKLRKARLAHLLVMAFNGYIIYHHINPRAPLDDATVDAVCTMLLGEEEET
jgi:AcrR family transcriptional regulator